MNWQSFLFFSPPDPKQHEISSMALHANICTHIIFLIQLINDCTCFINSLEVTHLLPDAQQL